MPKPQGKVIVNGVELNRHQAKSFLSNKLNNAKRQAKLLEAQLRSKEGRDSLPLLDAFGREKPTSGFGALSRRERRRLRKTQK